MSSDTPTPESPGTLNTDHPYYCNQGNYFDNGCHQTYGSWGEFLAADGDADLDMNLLFRWDWQQGEKEYDIPEGSADLLLFYMRQRKAVSGSVQVRVLQSQEAEIRAWLQIRWEHLCELWAPFCALPDLGADVEIEF